MKKITIPMWIRSYFRFILANWVFFFIMRFAFLWFFRDSLLPAHYCELWKTFYLGAKFDLRLACVLAIPLGIYWGVYAFVNGERKFGRLIAWGYALLEAGVFLVYLADFAHYSYVSMRINPSVLKYLENPLISLQMAWETYPVVWGVLGGIFWGSVAYRFVRNLQQKALKEVSLYNWKATLSWFLGVFLLTAGLIFGQISQHPLRWKNAYHSANSFICNLTLNPVLNLYDPARFAKVDTFDREKTTLYYETVAKYLRVDQPDKENLNFQRIIPAETEETGLNVVVILMESLAWNKTSLTQPDLDPTPFVKELADRSILFTRFFVPSSATSRAVFATITSIADVTAYQSSSQNPFVLDQQIAVNALKNYEKFFFIGGSASWGNIREVFTNNIANLQVYEEGKFENERKVDVWGISDLDLFREANRILEEKQKKSRKPFFAFIQTSGYHRPYTLPADNAGFETKEVDEELLKERSFGSVTEFNSLRFSDHALREFFNMAQKSDYYKKTVFFILGDHGLSAAKSENMPKGVVAHNLINNQVPFLITGAPITKPRVICKTASQVDVLPTMMSFTGFSYTTQALGRNLLASSEVEEGALIYAWASNPAEIGFVQGDYYYHSQDEQEALYNFLAENYNKNIAQNEPERFEHMKNLAHGLYETSRYMTYHNKKNSIHKGE